MKLGLPLELTRNGQEVHGYIPGPNGECLASDLGYKESVVRKSVATNALEILTHANRTDKNHAKLYIGCGDGTVLHVAWEHDAWGYSIVGPDKKHRCSTHGRGGFEEHCDLARKHATDCYGGVAWETR